MTTALPISGFPAASGVASGDIGLFTQGSTAPGTGTTRKVSLTQLFGSPVPIGNVAPNTAAFTSVEFNTAAASRLLSYVSADTALEYSVAGTKKFSVSDTGAVAASSAIFSATLASSTVPALRTGGNIVSASGAFQPSFNSQIGSVTGAMPNATNLLNIIQTQTDSSATTGENVNLGSYYTFGGAAFTGARANMRVVTVFSGNSSNTLVNGFHRGLSVTSQANAIDGGTVSVPNSNWVGIINDASLGTGALYWNSLIVQENDISIATGASAINLVGLQIVQKATHAVKASGSNIGLGFANQVGGSQPGYDTIISFGEPNGVWAPATTLIGTTPTALGGSAYTAVNGADFSAVTFSGAAFKSTGFVISPAGIVKSIKADLGNPANSQGVFDGSTTLAVRGNPTFAGAASGTFTVGINAAGSITSGGAYLNTISINDAINTTTGGSAPQVARGNFFNHVLNAGFTGERTGSLFLLSVSGAGNAYSAIDNSSFLVTAQVNAQASANAGGTNVAAVGNLAGLSSQVTLNSGATYYNIVENMEMGLAINAGASAQYANVMKLSAGAASGGVLSYNGLAIGKASSGVGFQYGIAFAPLETSGNPIDPTTGTLIGAIANGATLAAAYGVDISNYTFSGASFKSTGFSVDPNGRVTSTGRVKALRNVTASGAVTISSTSDEVVVINKTAGAATAVALPATPSTGRVYTIKDGKGDAAANNITISPAAGNIDGAATLVIAANYGSASLIYNGTQWNVV